MKKMIILKDSPKRGKTQTITKVFEMFKELGGMDKSLEIEILDSGKDETGDIYAVFKYKGQTIGLESAGDPGSNQEQLLEKFVGEGCDIIIGASRTAGETHDNVHNIMRKYDYDLFQISGRMDCWKGDPLFDAWNECYAKCIINYINEIICKSSSAD